MHAPGRRRTSRNFRIGSLGGVRTAAPAAAPCRRSLSEHLEMDVSDRSKTGLRRALKPLFLACHPRRTRNAVVTIPESAPEAAADLRAGTRLAQSACRRTFYRDHSEGSGLAELFTAGWGGGRARPPRGVCFYSGAPP